jgi:dienelactone hydrolase
VDAERIADLEPPALPPQPWSERALTRVGQALDAGVLRAMQAVVDALLMPPPERLGELRASADRLMDPALLNDPARFFAFAEDPPRPLRVDSRLRRPLPRGAVMSRRIEIAYRDYGSESERREHIPVEHWMHGPQAPRATVVALHGFTMGRPRLDALVLFAWHWYRLGLDVALVTLPHHGERTPPDARFSGQSFAVPDVGRLANAVRQAVFEIRTVMEWAREQAPAPVGLTGISLGGYLTALMAGLYDDLDFAVPMLPPVCIGDLAWRFFTRSRHYQGELPPAFSRPELRAAFRAHSPLAHPVRVPKERLMIIAGRGDRIVPPEHPSALWRHWGRPSIHWFSGGHLSPFGRQRMMGAITAHLRDLQIA